MIYRNQVLKDQEVSIDDNQFIDCHLINCTLIFEARNPPHLSSSRFDDCKFCFRGAAGLTLLTLESLHRTGLGYIVDEYINHALRSSSGEKA